MEQPNSAGAILMLDSTPDTADQALAELMDWVDDIADRFEAAWQALTPPALADFLGEADGLRRRALLPELVKLDIAYRRRLGEKRQIEDYLSEFRELAEVGEFKASSSSRLPGGTGPARQAGPTDTITPQAPKPEDTTSLPRLSGYEVLEELGRGGMGVVYKARQLGLNRLVALKMILPGVYSGSKQRARFRAEVEAAARLQHPNIVQIYEVGEEHGRPFCALEYVDGSSLAQRLAGTPLPPPLAARVVETLARAVHYAHQNHIIHRDLKPANILLQKSEVRGQKSDVTEAASSSDLCLLTSDLCPKITDFGLAKHLPGEGDLPSAPHDYQTQTGEILGTPSYMAPEQAEGKARETGPATDLYALGAILYELLTGRPPFKGQSTLDTLEQVRTQEPVSPSRLQPRLPHDLATICLKCLQKDAKKRYASGEELADDLQRFLDGKPIQARPVGRVEKIWRWCRRNPVVAGLTAGVVVLLLAAAVGAAVAAFRIDAARAQAESNLQRSQESLSQTQAGRGILLLEAGNTNGLLDLLTARATIEHIPHLRESRALLWSGWYASCAGRLAQVMGHDDAVLAVAFSPPDGRLMATFAIDGTVRLWDTATGRQQGQTFQSTPVPSGHCSIAFSPDGKLLAVTAGDKTPWLWDTATGRPHPKSIQHDAGVIAAAFSRDGTWLATAASGHEAQVWDTTTWQPHGPPLAHTGVNLARFSPDGALVASACNHGIVRLWETATGQPRGPALKHGRPGQHDVKVADVAFSPDGKLLATASWDDSARLWDTATGKPHGEPMLHEEDLWGLAFSPDGKRLATASFDGTARLWDTSTAKPLSPPLRHEGPVQAVAFSPDGTLLATGSVDTTARLWDTVSGAPYGLPLRHQGTVRALAFGPDGKQLASASLDGAARLWRVAAGEFQGRELPHQHRVWDVAFSPDSKRLATGSEDNVVRLWDAASGQLEAAPLRGEGNPVSVAISPDGKLLAAASGMPGVVFWELPSRRRTGKPLLTVNTPRAIAFSPDGTLLATGGDGLETPGCAQLWEVSGGRQRCRTLEHGGQVRTLAFHPQGKLLATGSEDRAVRLWDPTTGALREPLRHAGAVEAVAFSPDGKMLVSAARDLTVRFWDPATSRPIAQPLQVQVSVRALHFSPDGKLLATASVDGVVRLWDLTSRLPCSPPLAHGSYATSAAFSPDGRLLASGSFDRSARLWPVPRLVSDPQEMRLRTWVALGNRLNEQGLIEAIPWNEWQRLRDELRQLEAAHPPAAP